MKTYARIEAGKVLEVIEPAVYEEDIFDQGTPALPPSLENPEGTPAVPPQLVHRAGDEILISDRFHPDFVATLVEYDPENPPAEPEPEEVPPVVPMVVSGRQARLALLAAGKLQAVTAALAGLPDGQREAAQIEWEYATAINRQSPIVELLGEALGLDLDALFLQANVL